MTEAQKKKNRQTAAKLSKPTPVELPSGAWRCQVMVNGERISVVDNDPKTAHAKAVALRSGLLKQEKPLPAMTVSEAVDKYIKANDGVLSPSTLLSYKRIKKNSMAGISDIRLCDLTQERVQKWVGTLSKAKAAKTVRNAHGLLSKILSEYAPEVSLRTNLPQKDAKQISIPTEDEIAKIMQGCKGKQEELPILLAVWLGLRVSEIRGITWDCIKDGRLHIKQAIVDAEDGPALKKPKTVAGDRWIKLPEPLLELIEAQPKINEYVVQLTGQAIYKRFSRLCENLGLPHYRFHDLRHSAASVSMALGVPNKYSQQRMGHSTDNMLKTVYQHTMQKKEDEYADLIDGYYKALMTKNLHTNLHTDESSP